LAQSTEPKTRFDIVSKGVGLIAGGLMMIIIGIVVSLTLRNEFGLSMLIMGVCFGGYGAFQIYRGMEARTKQITCPHCGEPNQILSEVKSFTCFQCEKPLKLVAQRPPSSPGPRRRGTKRLS
jgi:hypothetical protein